MDWTHQLTVAIWSVLSPTLVHLSGHIPPSYAHLLYEVVIAVAAVVLLLAAAVALLIHAVHLEMKRELPLRRAHP